MLTTLDGGLARRVPPLLLVIACAMGVTRHSAGQAESRARTLYNQGAYSEAIAAALDDEASSATAALILGRAYLERFRETNDRANLSSAREALMRVNPNALRARERVELEIGIAEALYLDGAFGAAAELFDGVLARAELVAEGAAERALDWWATAVDRAAQRQDVENRDAAYRRILERMEDELRRNPGSLTASYWLPLAARELGDLERAWNATIAGWVRSTMASTGARALRDDLDRLMLRAIIPERAREATGDHLDATPTMEAMALLADEWFEVKSKWPDP